MMERQVGYAPDVLPMVGVGFLVTAFMWTALTHPSFFFSPQLEFYNPSSELAVTWLTQVVSFDWLFILPFSAMLLFFALTLLPMWFAQQRMMALLLLLITGSTFVIAWAVSPMHYIYLYFIALMYHFISWGYYFYQYFSATSAVRLRSYVIHHLVLLLPLGGLSVLVFVLHDQAVWYNTHILLYNGIIFITLSMIHNTTSFLNETWFRKIIGSDV
jgi:hypothetical protein